MFGLILILSQPSLFHYQIWLPLLVGEFKFYYTSKRHTTRWEWTDNHLPSLNLSRGRFYNDNQKFCSHLRVIWLLLFWTRSSWSMSVGSRSGFFFLTRWYDIPRSFRLFIIIIIIITLTITIWRGGWMGFLAKEAFLNIPCTYVCIAYTV